ncbi:MAG: DUF4384 domain-containing protein [Saprospiraceae bacterium]|nr:DUF4384 domain-containing protein [Saprospiraceae bacterium]
MPIRLEDDKPQDNRGPKPRPQNPNTGGNGMLGRLLPFILMFVLRKPKLIIPLLVIAAGWYFFLGPGSQSGGLDSDQEQASFFFGATLSEEQYDKAQVFEPLTYGAMGGSSSLPRSVSLLQYAPKRGHQGQQGSCVGWASSYAARTILYSKASGQNPNTAPFSPSYLYNQIALTGCQGAYMRDAMEALKQGGVLPLSQYPYTDRSCTSQPDRTEQSQAQQYRIKGYNRLTTGANNYSPDIAGIRQHLAQGAPVVIGMQVGGTFMHQMEGKSMWTPTNRDYSGYGFSGHAMCVIGYDDTKDGGAFQLMNSWGPSWGENGVAWVRYPDFEHFVKEAYGLYPEGTSPQLDPDKLSVQFGLVNNATQSLIPLRETGKGVFRSSTPIKIGDPFKVAIANSIECYVYVFGQESDGSSYVLFPYNEKYSAYCGIAGTRIFPREKSLVADNIGQRDRIAIVVSKTELDYQRLNQVMNQSRQSSYTNKLHEALSSIEINNVTFKAGEAVEFSCDANGQQQAVGMIIEIDKQ